MSRFYGTGVNGRGNTVSFGGQQSAGQVHLRGWNAGVRVVPIGVKGEADRFEVYMTSGSHASSSDVLLGTVHDTADGPQFILAGEEESRESVQTLAVRNGTYRNESHP
jgi:hypothetical protein